MGKTVYLAKKGLFNSTEIGKLSGYHNHSVNRFVENGILFPKQENPYGYDFNQVIFLNIVGLLQNFKSFYKELLTLQVKLGNSYAEPNNDAFQEDIIFDCKSLQNFSWKEHDLILFEYIYNQEIGLKYWNGIIENIQLQTADEYNKYLNNFIFNDLSNSRQKNSFSDFFNPELLQPKLIVNIDKLREHIYSLAERNDIHIDERFSN